MNPLEELEKLALNAGGDEEPTEEQTRIWQRTFGYSRARAKTKIEEHKADVSRTKITDEQWEVVAEKEKEKHGHNRDAYEHTLQLAKTCARVQTPSGPITDLAVEDPMTHIMKLGDPDESFHDAEDIRIIASLDCKPRIETGLGYTGEARFCLVNAERLRPAFNYSLS